MKWDLMDVLCCPMCKRDLTLIVTNETGTEVIEGTLHCPHCGMEYHIEDGIPNLLPPD